MTEQEKLWVKVRALLVAHEVMKPDGSPTSDETAQACQDFRKLFLGGTK